ncbi:hypothetical protein GCM10009624_28290 [Gordonia sinesedis]
MLTAGDGRNNPATVKKIIASTLIVGAVSVGIVAGSGPAAAKVDGGKYRYCNTEMFGIWIPFPNCSTAVVRNDRIYLQPNASRPIAATRDGGSFTLGGTRFVLRKAKHGYAGTSYSGGRPTGKFVMTHIR